ncbi:MAG: hypothetical protein IMZ66_13120, partial [Planctomycetes bacterium]|nr:hypothetical protein [Planctomycetota bacterium]
LIVGGVAGAFSGLEKINGRGAEKNETVIRPSKFDNDRVYVVAVKVQTTGGQARIETTLDGSPFVQWAGSVEGLAASYQVAARGCFGLGCWGAGYTFERARVRMLSGTARLLRAADAQAAAPAAAAAVPPSRWTDLLALVDPAKDTVSGTWRRQGPVVALLGGPTGARITLPVALKGSYRLQVEFTRTAGQEPLAFVLPTGASSAALVLSAGGGQNSGLENIWGKAGDANETTVRPGTLENNRRHTVDISVMLTGERVCVQVTLDGEKYIQWEGPQAALSVHPAWRVPTQHCPALGAFKGDSVVYSKARLCMLSGEARPLRPAGK